VHFTETERALLDKALFETLPEFKSKIRIFSPRCSLYALYRSYTNEHQDSYPCRGGIDFYFIDSRDGSTYPCGYRGQESLGRYWDIDFHGSVNEPFCRQCDWECFRDPSELLGPPIQLFSNPIGLMKKWRNTPHFFHLWINDLKYYRACDLFNGRKPPNYDRLSKFAVSESAKT
jgi:hypothetical protein